jgi:hypothetical protein
MADVQIPKRTNLSYRKGLSIEKSGAFNGVSTLDLGNKIDRDRWIWLSVIRGGCVEICDLALSVLFWGEEVRLSRILLVAVCQDVSLWSWWRFRCDIDVIIAL